MDHKNELDELCEHWGYTEDDANAIIDLATNLGMCSVGCYPGKPVIVEYSDDAYIIKIE